MKLITKNDPSRELKPGTRVHVYNDELWDGAWGTVVSTERFDGTKDSTYKVRLEVNHQYGPYSGKVLTVPLRRFSPVHAKSGIIGTMKETTVAKSYESSLQAMIANIKEAVRNAKKEGTVGMSEGNLRQIVSTRGVDVSPGVFQRLFSEAVSQVRVAGFDIYKSGGKQVVKDALQDCVSRKIPKIAQDHPEMEEDQRVAVAYSMCGEKSIKKGGPSSAEMLRTRPANDYGIGDWTGPGWYIVDEDGIVDGPFRSRDEADNANYARKSWKALGHHRTKSGSVVVLKGASGLVGVELDGKGVVKGIVRKENHCVVLSDGKVIGPYSNKADVERDASRMGGRIVSIPSDLHGEQAREYARTKVKSMSTASGTAGGYAVPEEMKTQKENRTCAHCKRTLPVADDQTDPGDDEVALDSQGLVSRNNYVCGRCLERYSKSLQTSRNGATKMKSKIKAKTKGTPKAPDDVDDDGTHEREEDEVGDRGAEAEVQKDDGEPDGEMAFEPKHSAVVTAALVRHKGDEDAYLNGELAKMDHPQYADGLKKYQEHRDEGVKMLKDLFEEHHPDHDLEKMVAGPQETEMDGDGEAQANDEDKGLDDNAHEGGDGEHYETTKDDGFTGNESTEEILQRYNTPKHLKKSVGDGMAHSGNDQGVQGNDNAYVAGVVKAAGCHMKDLADHDDIPNLHKSGLRFHAKELHAVHKALTGFSDESLETGTGEHDKGISDESLETGDGLHDELSKDSTPVEYPQGDVEGIERDTDSPLERNKNLQVLQGIAKNLELLAKKIAGNAPPKTTPAEAKEVEADDTSITGDDEPAATNDEDVQEDEGQIGKSADNPDTMTGISDESLETGDGLHDKDFSDESLETGDGLHDQQSKDGEDDEVEMDLDDEDVTTKNGKSKKLVDAVTRIERALAKNSQLFTRVTGR